MAVARDIVWISVPFAAGAATGSLACASPATLEALCAAASATVLLAGLLCLRVWHIGSGLPERRARLLVGAAFLLTGVFCSLQPSLTAGCPELASGPLGRLAAKSADRMRGCIEGIPFPTPTTSSLVKALLTGDRQSLSKETIEVFRASGASHILALSGLHLGIIYLILSKLAIPFGNSPKATVVKCVLIVGASGFYTVMAGASPSIVRAFLFIALAEGLRLTGRKRDAPRILLSSLTIQLALKPEVISSLGFQLSYLAMGGVIFINPHLKDLYPESGLKGWDRVDPLRRLWQVAAMSLSCQALTAPLVWLRFRTFPEYFLITNLLALPMTSAIMVLSVATIALSSFGICPQLLVSLDDAAVQALVWCLGIISEL